MKHGSMCTPRSCKANMPGYTIDGQKQVRPIFQWKERKLQSPPAHLTDAFHVSGVSGTKAAVTAGVLATVEQESIAIGATD